MFDALERARQAALGTATRIQTQVALNTATLQQRATTALATAQAAVAKLPHLPLPTTTPQSTPSPFQVATQTGAAVARATGAPAPRAVPTSQDVHRGTSRGTDILSQRKAEAQATLTRVAGPAPSFEEGGTHPIYEGGQAINVEYQKLIKATEPIWSLTNPLRSIPAARALHGGFARAPGKFIEGASWLIPASERAGQLLWKEPEKLPDTLSRFATEQVEGLQEGFERDPWGTAGELIGTAAIGFALGGARGPVKGPRGKTGGGSPAPTAVSTPTPRRGRFRSLEFGFQTKLVPKPQESVPRGRYTGPKTVEELIRDSRPWLAEREAFARLQAERMRASTRGAPLQTVTAPVEASGSFVGAQTVAGTGAVMMGAGAGDRSAYAGSILDFDPSPTERYQQTVQGQRSGQPTVQGQRVVQQTVNDRQQDQQTDQGQRVVQQTVNDRRQGSSTVQGSRFDRPTGHIQRGVQTTDQDQHGGQRTVRRGVSEGHRTPLIFFPPTTRVETPRRRKRRKDEEERRRRLQGQGAGAHWELGGAPGTREMSMLVFGRNGPTAPTLRGTVLDFSPRPRSYPKMGANGALKGKKPSKLSFS